MTSKTQLAVGETGYVQREQLWLSNVEKFIRLYVEPRFVNQAQAKQGMLRVKVIASQATPGGTYGIYLPDKALFGSIRQWLTRQEAAQRSLIHVPLVFILSKTPGKKPFATTDFFYFGQVN